MGRRKRNEYRGSKSGLIYTNPYLNLVRGILEQMLNDLVIEANYGSLKKARNDAFCFFFDEKSYCYQGFRAWCDLAGFRESYWQKKALIKIAVKVVKKPIFYRKVLNFVRCNKKYGNLLKNLIMTANQSLQNEIYASDEK